MADQLFLFPEVFVLWRVRKTWNWHTKFLFVKPRHEDMSEQTNKQTKNKEIRKCCIFTSGDYPNWPEGPPNLLSKILKSFVRLSRNQLVPKFCLGFHIWQRLRFIKISEVTREPPVHWPHLGPILSSCWAQADSQQGSQLA